MLKSTNGISLFTKNYLVKTPKASVLIVHGLGEHCERYSHVAKELNGIGANVYTFDLRGHGKSEGERFFVSDMHHYREDLEVVYRSVPKDLPFFIIGHSMGGLITTTFLLYNERTDISGVVLSGAALEVGEDITPVTQKVVSFLGKIVPKLKTVKIDPTLISRDKEEVEKYKKDPLINHEGAKAGLGLALLKGINEVKPKLEDFNYSVLIMHGSNDKIANVDGSIALHEKSISNDKTLKIWDGAYHEIFNETNRNDVIQYTSDWIKNRI